jgi:methylenetetrahydrofolate dehydrogenase (NADP+) / methenyltetrahydrofolate cyclohydrolase
MEAKIIDGKQVAGALRKRLKTELQGYLAQDVTPTLAVIQVGEDPASSVYVRNKHLACAEIGIRSLSCMLPHTVSETDLLSKIDEFNRDKTVHGILVQLPLPSAINTSRVLASIDVCKDVDGFHAHNVGKLLQKQGELTPCTPRGIMTLLAHTGISLPGKHAVVIGASTSVGRPMAMELLNGACTVTVCNSRTEDLAYHVGSADIVVAAVGKPELVKGEWIKDGAVVIDVGINRQEDGKLVGDVDFQGASKKAAWITPVPGGVGPMTVATLMENTLRATALQQSMV